MQISFSLSLLDRRCVRDGSKFSYHEINYRMINKILSNPNNFLLGPISLFSVAVCTFVTHFTWNNVRPHFTLCFIWHGILSHLTVSLICTSWVHMSDKASMWICENIWKNNAEISCITIGEMDKKLPFIRITEYATTTVRVYPWLCDWLDLSKDLEIYNTKI